MLLTVCLVAQTDQGNPKTGETEQIQLVSAELVHALEASGLDCGVEGGCVAVEEHGRVAPHGVFTFSLYQITSGVGTVATKRLCDRALWFNGLGVDTACRWCEELGKSS